MIEKGVEEGVGDLLNNKNNMSKSADENKQIWLPVKEAPV